MENKSNAETKNFEYRQGNTVTQVSELNKNKNPTTNKDQALVHTVLNYLGSTRNNTNNSDNKYTNRKISREGSYDESFNTDNETFNFNFLNNDEKHLANNNNNSQPRNLNEQPHLNAMLRAHSDTKNGHSRLENNNYNSTFINNNNNNNNNGVMHHTLEFKKEKNPELEAKFVKAKLRNNRKKEIEKTNVSTVPGDPATWNLDDIYQQLEGETIKNKRIGNDHPAAKKDSKKDVKKSSKKKNVANKKNIIKDDKVLIAEELEEELDVEIALDSNRIPAHQVVSYIEVENFDEQTSLPLKPSNTKTTNQNSVDFSTKNNNNKNRQNKKNSLEHRNASSMGNQPVNNTKPSKNGVQKTGKSSNKSLVGNNDIVVIKGAENGINNNEDVEFLKRTWMEFLKGNPPLRYNAKNGQNPIKNKIHANKKMP